MNLCTPSAIFVHKTAMARLRLATATERDQSHCARPAMTAGRPDGLARAFDGGSIGAQTVRLGNGQLQNVQRTTLAAENGRVQGNHHLQKVISPLADGPLADGPVIIRQHASPNTIARSLVTDAERRAGTIRPAAWWPRLSAGDAGTVRGHIHHDRRQQAVDTLAGALGLSSQNVTRQVSTTISDDGSADPYVLAGPRCSEYRSGTRAAQHWQLHRTDPIHIIVSINERVFQLRSERERLIKLYTTLMHEYTHVEQIRAEGIHARTRFRAPQGNREFLSFASEAERDVVGPLQEIDAVSAEIENAQITALETSSQIQFAANYLWEQYRSYRSNLGRVGRSGVDTTVASRVYRNIHQARDMFMNLISSTRGINSIAATVIQSRRRGTRLTSDPRNVITAWLYSCPRGYSDGERRRLAGEADSAARADVSRLLARETAFQGSIPGLVTRIEQRITELLRD